MKKLVHDNSTAVLGIQGTDSKLKPTDVKKSIIYNIV